MASIFFSVHKAANQLIKSADLFFQMISCSAVSGVLLSSGGETLQPNEPPCARGESHPSIPAQVSAVLSPSISGMLDNSLDTEVKWEPNCNTGKLSILAAFF